MSSRIMAIYFWRRPQFSQQKRRHGLCLKELSLKRDRQRGQKERKNESSIYTARLTKMSKTNVGVYICREEAVMGIKTGDNEGLDASFCCGDKK